VLVVIARLEASLLWRLALLSGSLLSVDGGSELKERGGDVTAAVRLGQRHLAASEIRLVKATAEMASALSLSRKLMVVKKQ